jgi:hypothetical protein
MGSLGDAILEGSMLGVKGSRPGGQACIVQPRREHTHASVRDHVWASRFASTRRNIHCILLYTDHLNRATLYLDRRAGQLCIRGSGLICMKSATTSEPSAETKNVINTVLSPVALPPTTVSYVANKVGQTRNLKTYSSEDSRVVTHRSTNSPVSCLCMAEVERPLKTIIDQCDTG